MQSNEDSYAKDATRSRGKFKKESFNARTEHLEAEETM